MINFTSSVPELKSVAVNFDDTTRKWEMQVLGEGFTGDKTTTEFVYGGVNQEIKEVTTTSVKVVFTNITDGTVDLKSSKLYFDIGLPSNHSIISNNSLKLTPKLVSLSISEGSVGSSLITANVQGVGLMTKNLEFVDSITKKSLC